MNHDAYDNHSLPETGIDVIAPGHRARSGRIPLQLWSDVRFSIAGLQSYSFTNWQPVLHDAMVLAAAIEFGDKTLKRPSTGWARRISIRIPAHNPSHWREPAVATALKDAIEFLTGDEWSFEFVELRGDAPSPPQDYLFRLPVTTSAVLPYSDGMDSRAVAGILNKTHGEGLVRVRIGSKNWDRSLNKNSRLPFTAVPYKVRCNKRNREATARTRGFKFSLISCIAAFLTDAKTVVIPESGQGAIGPALLHLGHIYPDYRNHPMFGKKMATFVNALFGANIRFEYPRIWSTKGETLREYVSSCNGFDWQSTRSCWRGNNWASIDGELRQCGVCAACMLRRVSVHAAGLIENSDTYIAADLNAKTLHGAMPKSFNRHSPIFQEYAIAGVLHMDHLADLAATDALPIVKRHAVLISAALNIDRTDAVNLLTGLLQKHSEEWRSFLGTLEPHSFLKQWVQD